MKCPRTGSVARSLPVFALILALAVGGCGKSDTQNKDQTPAAASRSVPTEAAETTADTPQGGVEASLPRVIDLGRGMCIPCKKMAPILEDLAEEYGGRAVIEVIDIGEPGGREIAGRYKIRVIPTQIFLDREGNEVWRHEGFLPRDEIVQKLREMGVEET